jgi:hypothetical protein
MMPSKPESAVLVVVERIRWQPELKVALMAVGVGATVGAVVGATVGLGTSVGLGASVGLGTSVGFGAAVGATVGWGAAVGGTAVGAGGGAGGCVGAGVGVPAQAESTTMRITSPIKKRACFISSPLDYDLFSTEPVSVL